MHAKVLTLALLTAIVALPVPASQMLAGTFSAPAPRPAAAPAAMSLGLLLQDPFLIDRLSHVPAAGPGDADPHRAVVL